MSSIKSFHTSLAFLVPLVLLGATAAAAAPAPAARLDSPGLAASLRAVAPGESAVVLGVPLAPGGAAVLELERFEVFARGARLVVHGAGGDTVLARPANAYFHGRIAGEPRSRAVVTVRASGEVRGVVARPGAFWLLAPGAGGAAAPPVVGRVDAAAELGDRVAGFACEAGDLLGPEALLEEALGGPAPQAAPRALAGGPVVVAQVAVETDHEYYTLFASDADRLDYAGDLIAFASTVYADEVSTALEISQMELWATAADPWTEAPGSCALYQFGRYWNQNHGGDQRTIAHMLSGRGPNVGVAWIGVLCNGAFSVNLDLPMPTCLGLSPRTDAYGGDYGFTGGISGAFDIGNPGVVWDIVATSHEIGHNFNSPHTHCYSNLGGNPLPVDQCYNGQCGQSNCWCGSASLPCATPGAGCGTLMSYCHTLGGNLANIALTFGEGHPFGVAPERVPARMNAHVVSRDGANPGCFADPLFGDGFESGDTSAWSGSVP
jgi:hypothetical protein